MHSTRKTSLAPALSAVTPTEDVATGLQRHLQSRHGAVERIETHISCVLLAGDFAYKLKKPVDLGFLDFSTLAARRHFCEEELRLNRRLVPALYLEVVPIHAGLEGPTLDGSGPVIEVAVKMHRFAQTALASERLTRGVLSGADMGRLARRLADFHVSASQAAAGTDFGSAQTVLGDALRALDRLKPLVDDDCLRLRQWFEERSAALAPRWEQRRHSGRVREGHGDLHLDNVLVLPDEVTAFDCIEFDPSLRWIDVMNDIAYVLMDLEAHGHCDLLYAFLDAYLEATGDFDGLDVLRFYLVYRAVVRALVNGLQERERLGKSGPRTRQYLQAAHRLADLGQARLLITHGLPGSGKSWVSGQLLVRAGAVRLRSDVERKRLAGLPPLANSARVGDLYTEVHHQTTYQRLADSARQSLVAGFPTIVDAAFLRRSQRSAFRALASELGVPFTILNCRAPLSVLRNRVELRQLRTVDASEAGPAVLAALEREHEPLDADECRHILDVDTDQPVDELAIAARWLLEAKGA